MRKNIRILLFAALGIAAVVLFMVFAVRATAVEGSDWNELKSTLQSGGFYRMTADIHATEDGSVPVTGSARLDLNGFELVVDGERTTEEDLFAVSGSLDVESTKDSGTLRADNGRSVVGVTGGRARFHRVYAHGYRTDHVVYCDAGRFETSGGKLFGLTTGDGDGGGVCLVNGSAAELASGVISRLEGQRGGGIYVDESSTISIAPDFIVENCYARNQGGAMYADLAYANLEAYINNAEVFDERDCSAALGYDAVRAVVIGNAWEELKGTVSRGYTYQLTGDITDHEYYSVDLREQGGTVWLNGHMCDITGEGDNNLFHVHDGGTFAIEDNEGRAGLLRFTNGVSAVKNDGDFAMRSAVLETDQCPSVLINWNAADLHDSVVRGTSITQSCIRNVTNTTFPLLVPTLKLRGTTEVSGGYCGTGQNGKGGGVYSGGRASVLEMTDDALVRDCSSSWWGGGVYAEGTVRMSGNARIAACHAANNGGAVYLAAKARMEMRDASSLADCGTDSFGGAVEIEQGTLTMRDESSIQNCSSVYGGGISNSGTVTMTDASVIRGCRGSHGGAICNGSVVVMEKNAQITQNSATVLGGGVYNNARGDLTINKNATITQNTCSRSTNGAGVHNYSASSTTKTYSRNAIANNTPKNIFGAITVI